MEMPIEWPDDDERTRKIDKKKLNVNDATNECNPKHVRHVTQTEMHEQAHVCIMEANTNKMVVRALCLAPAHGDRRSHHSFTSSPCLPRRQCSCVCVSARIREKKHGRITSNVIQPCRAFCSRERKRNCFCFCLCCCVTFFVSDDVFFFLRLFFCFRFSLRTEIGLFVCISHTFGYFFSSLRSLLPSFVINK